ncbi:MAG: helix-turn-helix domain-containing protein [Phycisphaera sp.]|nr:helix-turn-helix domain-containing protein [Phycisphaera sp.]
MTPTILDPEFFENLRFDDNICRLFEFVPGVLFFVKDRQSRLVACNTTHKHALFRFVPPEDMRGKSSHDFFPTSLATAFAEDDAYVIRTGEPVLERIELNVTSAGLLSWFCTSKFPLRDAAGKIAGLVGISRQLNAADKRLNPFTRVLPAVEHLQEHYRDDVEVATLARKCHLSVPQFHREFKKNFRMTPRQFLIRLRIHDACGHLSGRALSIGEVAFRCGFSDQNYFARQFKQVMRVTPSEFRNRHKA